jgi:hypothetical protein
LIGYPIINRTHEFVTWLGPVVVNVFNAVLTILMLLSIPQLLRLRLNLADRCLLCFAVSALIATALAINPLFSIRGYVLGVIEPVGLYLLLRVAYGAAPAIYRLVAVIGGFVVVHWMFIALEAVRAGGLVELIMARVRGGFIMTEGGRFFTGGLNEPKQAAMLIILLFPLFQFVGGSSSYWWCSLAAMGIVVETVISLARLEAAMLLMELPLAYVVARRFGFSRVGKGVILGGLLTAAVLVPTVPLFISRSTGQAENAGIWSRPDVLGGIETDVNTIFYVAIAYASMGLVVDHPLGIGLQSGNYYAAKVGRYFDFLDYENTTYYSIVPHVVSLIHLGILPTLIYVSFLVVLARGVWATAKGGETPEARLLASGAFVTIVLNGLLFGRMGAISVGGYQMSDGDFMRTQFPDNQQAVWSLVVLALASSIGTFGAKAAGLDRAVEPPDLSAAMSGLGQYGR